MNLSVIDYIHAKIRDLLVDIDICERNRIDFLDEEEFEDARCMEELIADSNSKIIAYRDVLIFLDIEQFREMR